MATEAQKHESRRTENVDPFVFDLNSLSFEGREKLKDRTVVPLSTTLKDESILVVVCAGIAAYKTPGLVRMLRSYGATVDVRMTERAPAFIGTESLRWAAEGGQVWEGGALSGEVEHLKRYSAVVVVPGTYDFINGMAAGRADTPALTTMASALGRIQEGGKVLVLPCMNGSMNNGVLAKNMEFLSSLGVEFIAPRTDRGKLEYPGSDVVTIAVARSLSRSPLKGMNVLISGGPTPVPIDDVRRITNIFKGKLGCEIAAELVLRGANPRFLLGGGLGIPAYLEPFTQRYSVYSEYRDRVLEEARNSNAPKLAILSAAVADYQLSHVYEGKITSKQSEIELPKLVPTEKVVDLLHEAHPELPIISFKLLARVSVEELLSEARRRLNTHSQVVVANRLEDCSATMQTVYLVSRDGERQVSGTKREVAAAILDLAESIVTGDVQRGKEVL